MGSQNESREREILTEFISLYIDLPCLWDIGSDLYKDKNQKTQAWELLKEKLNEIDPEANIAATKKKVEHMRSAFKREYKKVKESKRTGAGANDVHVPNLWYYNLLLPVFEKKDDQSRRGVDTLSSDEESISSEYEKGRKKKKNTLEIKKQTLIETAQELLQSDDRKEKQKKINSFGLYVGEQLDQVETFQRQVAEKLISDILFLAKTGNLNFESRIETTASSRNFTLSRSSSSKNSYTQQAPSYQMIHTSLPPHQHQPSSSLRSVLSSPSPQHFQTSSFPHYIHPSPSPSPQHIQSPSSSQHSQSPPSPHHIQQYPSSQHIQPAPSSQHSQPAPSPHLQIISQGFQPASSPHPQHIQAPPSPQHIQLSSSPQFQILSQSFQPAPSPHQIQPSSQHIQAIPPAQNNLPSTSIQRQLPPNDENENIYEISIPSPSHVMSNDSNNLLYEGPARGMSDLMLKRKGKIDKGKIFECNILP